ncbi:AraC family transcriptional regulator [Komagataeibacter diospyri]|uniref:AraC family transcriptional regulator n=1 Tax=Komagataeibacter diospyri TaxID=1932662 RepID=A0A4P5NVF7_9PROT|nr:AraC family transcriptional regulator [Komagataeibacter diospyri]GCE82354.1 AraC family transcriptional regulator [Komagataeibacter diospyri]GCE88707.1 AraC family transcriptional regulator [Komagataeibacter diospyri]
MHAHMGESRAVRPPVFEVIQPGPRQSFVWHRHDYPAACARWNYHPEYELHLITAGTGHFMVGDFLGTFAPGHLVLVGPDLPHGWFSDLSMGERIAGRDIVMQARGDWLRQLVGLCPELEAVSTLLADARYGVVFTGPMVPVLAARLAAMGGMNDAARLAALIGLLSGLAACPRQRLTGIAPFGAEGQARVADRDLERMDRVIRHLLSGGPHDIRQADMARQVGLSGPAFSRLFRRATGSTFVSFMRRLRVSHACRMLAETDASIAEISSAAGFANLSNFNRQFLEICRTTPRCYRRDVRNLSRVDDPIERTVMQERGPDQPVDRK